ncbi:uncharacterized protein RAG0_10438 [Rhynchosporium agropyri]|uniref:Uncharacterized protein n=1 Tax=Rhynchosporium agropyri TaxID=914238 RepID=A0A1E1KZV9_9HELO|nr:uncharacterized protein RAG0_10438 [Rhynchosporium agropyri]
MTVHKMNALTMSAPSQGPRDKNGESNGVHELAPIILPRVSDEEQYDDDYEDPIPSLAEGMAKNPGKSRKEVKYARGLWASGMIEIHNSAEKGDDYSDDGSWPILEWEILVRGYPFNAWTDFDAILRFVYRGELDRGHPGSAFDTTEGDIINWCLGRILQCPKLQNETMKAIMRRDAATDKGLFSQSDQTFIFLGCPVAECTWMMEKIGVVHKGDGEFEPHKLMSYMIDRLIWDATNGGYAYLNVVHRGGCVANMVARAQVDAATKPKLRFAPWHVFNRHKYL